MSGAWLAAACAGIALASAMPQRSAAVRTRLGLPRPRTGWPLWFAMAGVATVILGAGPVPAMLSGTALGLAWFVRRRWLAHRARRDHAHRIDEAAEAVDALAAELAAGAAPSVALARIATGLPTLHRARIAAELDGDVPGALRSHDPVVRPLNDLAAAWTVADRTGAPLVEVLDGIAAHVAAERESRRHVTASLAPARATGHTLALLPVIGVILGTAMGYSPLTFLTQTLIGAVLLAVGVALACLGVWWVDRLVDAAEEPR